MVKLKLFYNHKELLTLAYLLNPFHVLGDTWTCTKYLKLDIFECKNLTESAINCTDRERLVYRLLERTCINDGFDILVSWIFWNFFVQNLQFESKINQKILSCKNPTTNIADLLKKRHSHLLSFPLWMWQTFWFDRFVWVATKLTMVKQSFIVGIFSDVLGSRSVKDRKRTSQSSTRETEPEKNGGKFAVDIDRVCDSHSHLFELSSSWFITWSKKLGWKWTLF